MSEGRSVLWFLDTSLSPHTIRRFYRETQSCGYGLIFRGLIRALVDEMAWKKLNPSIQLDDYPYVSTKDEHGKDWFHPYRELCGKGQMMFVEKGKKYIQFLTDKPRAILNIPFSVIRSTYSSGFPKVAYLPDQYLIGLQPILEAFSKALSTGTDINYEWKFFQSANFDTPVFLMLAEWKELYQRYQKSMPKDVFNTLAALLDVVTLLAKETMMIKIIRYPKSPYHGMIEDMFDLSLLKHDHPITVHYKQLRTRKQISQIR